MRRAGLLLGLLGVFAILIVPLLAWGTLQLESLITPRLGIPARLEGGFAEGGALPHGLPPPKGLGFWSSWCHDDNRLGSVLLGPFEAPRRLSVFLSGYAQAGKNTLAVRNLNTGEVRRQGLSEIGERWQSIRLDLPESWRRAPVEITVVDASTGPGGWIAVSQPFTNPWWTEWARHFGARLAGLAVVALTATLLIACAGRLLVQAGWVEPDSVFLLPLACGAVAAFGYVVFLVSVASLTALQVLTWSALLGAVLFLLVPGRRRIGSLAELQRSGETLGGTLLGGRVLVLDRPQHAPAQTASPGRHDWWWTALVSLTCGVFVFSVLHLFGDGTHVSGLAQSRFLENDLPSDNTLPQALAERILNGQPANAMFGDWHGSDRPPLQTGWVLAVAPLALRLGFDMDVAGQAAGLLFQLIAIPAVWALLRRLGATRALAVAIVFAIVPSGFFFINLTYTWTKLAAGAFALAAFLLWFGREPDDAGVKHPSVAAGALMGLAWLSHGGVGFAILALAPWVIRSAIPRWRLWLLSAATFAVLAGSWAAYQKWYDPPGNRLAKWHLAGVIPPDDRGTLETIVTAYRARPFEAWLASRGLNVRSLYWGRWSDLVAFDFDQRASRRSDEFYHTFFALGWWNLGFIALPVLLTGRRDSAVSRLASRAILWTAATFAVWVALYFVGGHTVIHQGSYTTLLVLFPVLALALARLHIAALVVIASAQFVAFAALWMQPLDDMTDAAVHPPALVVALVAVLSGGALLLCARRIRHAHSSTSPEPVASPDTP